MNPFARLYAFWLGIPPAMREPVRSAVVSLLWGSVTAIGTLFGVYFTDHKTWDGFLGFLCSPHSVGAIAAAAAAVYRAQQAAQRVATTVTLHSGAEAVITKAAPPAAS